MESNDANHQWGKKWMDSDIKGMLQIALELRVNDLFASKQFSQEQIYKMISERMPGKNWGQIKLKFEKLRRGYSVQKIEKNKSGNSGGDTTIYDEEMVQLWELRPKFVVPEEHGVDTAKICFNKPNENEDILTGTSDDSQIGSSLEKSNDSISFEAKSRKRGRRPLATVVDNLNSKMGQWMEQINKYSEDHFEKSKKLLLECEERADKRMYSFLEEMKKIMGNSAGPSSSGETHPGSIFIPADTGAFIEITNPKRCKVQIISNKSVPRLQSPAKVIGTTIPAPYSSSLSQHVYSSSLSTLPSSPDQLPRFSPPLAVPIKLSRTSSPFVHSSSSSPIMPHSPDQFVRFSPPITVPAKRTKPSSTFISSDSFCPSSTHTQNAASSGSLSTYLGTQKIVPRTHSITSPPPNKAVRFSPFPVNSLETSTVMRSSFSSNFKRESVLPSTVTTTSILESQNEVSNEQTFFS